MLICKFKRAFHMKSVFKTLSSLMEEVVIKADASGLKLITCDPSVTTYISVSNNNQ